MRMLTYFINRGGHGLSASRRAELERAGGKRETMLGRRREPRLQEMSADNLLKALRHLQSEFFGKL